jgi:hypothetical protein
MPNEKEGEREREKERDGGETVNREEERGSKIERRERGERGE